MKPIRDISAREIIDSRGYPTIEAIITLDDNTEAYASVPSGASTGTKEAIELRDNESGRFKGKGVKNICKKIEIIAKEFKGREFCQQRLDRELIALDGTKNKSNFGANLILAVSIAYAKVQALAEKRSLFLSIIDEFDLDHLTNIPLPMANLLNGGAHANNSLSIQEFMIIPNETTSYQKQLQQICEIYQTLKLRIHKQKLSTSVGDEGGFAPTLKSTDEAINLLIDSTIEAGYKPGEDTFLALDVASSEFYSSGFYQLDKQKLSSEGMIDFLDLLCQKYPIISIEDGLAEDDWEGWKLMTSRLGNKVQLVGDDLFVTNTALLQKGIDEQVANAILIKPNQIGTITETLEAISLAKNKGYKTIMSHRSGETEDTFIADLAVATNSSYTKFGATARSERTGKYNQLLRISEILRA